MDIKAVINQYYDLVHKLAYSKTRNLEDTNDLTQDVFLKFLQSNKKFESDEHIKNWLIRVTINTYLKQISSGWNKNTTFMTDELLGAAEGSNSNFSYRDQYIIEDDVLELINTLPDKNREILWLFYYNDMSIRDIAVKQNKTESAVKMQLSRSRKILKEKLERKHLISKQMFISIDKQLKAYFKRYEEIFISKGIQYKHRKPIENICIIVTDMANGWTKPGHPFTCDIGDSVKNVRKICDTVRKTNLIPIMFFRTIYNSKSDAKVRLRGNKIPAEDIEHHNYWTSIDDELDVQECEMVITKTCMSCFGKDNLDKYLNALNIDTIIIAGVTASGAIRYTVMDAYCRGYNVIVVKDAIADRIAGAVHWNLFDMEMNFAEILSADEVIKLIELKTESTSFDDTAFKESLDTDS